MTDSCPNLVADIGGTNARFALVEPGAADLRHARTLRCADYPDLVSAVRAYLVAVGAPAPVHAVIAVATPVTGDQVVMTNHTWRFSVSATRVELGLASCRVINDFSALALALPELAGSECRQIGGGRAVPGQAIAVLGPGTGLGVSGLIVMGRQRNLLQGEGGHVSYGPQTDREAGVISVLRRVYPHVSAERLVSGPGLALLYQALAELDGIRVEACAPGEVTRMALQGYCAVAEEALDIFCAVLGTVAGDLALTLGARGGVFIGGGIVPSLGGYFDASPFRARFEQHGRFSAYLAQVPTYVIEASMPALTGARAALATGMQHLGVASPAHGDAFEAH